MLTPGDIIRPTRLNNDLALYRDSYSDLTGKARRDHVGIITDKAICLVLATCPHPDKASDKVQLLLLTSQPTRLGWTWDDFFERLSNTC